MYKIVFTERAIKDLDKLDKQCQIRIAQKLKEYSISPFEHLIKLTNPIIGTYRFRIGDYRIIFDIVENSIVVLRLYQVVFKNIICLFVIPIRSEESQM